MRKLLLTLTVLAGAAAVSGGAKAAPLAGHAVKIDQPAAVQTVAYHRYYHRRYYHRPVYRRYHR